MSYKLSQTQKDRYYMLFSFVDSRFIYRYIIYRYIWYESKSKSVHGNNGKGGRMEGSSI